MVTTIVDRQKPKIACKTPQYILGVAAALISALTSYAHAAEWQIQPTTNIRQTYTDNVNLVAQGAEKSDFVTEITPGILIVGSGRDLKVRLNYAMQNLFYANNSNAGTIRNQLDADAHGVLVDDLFFWDAKGQITQQNISPLGAQTSDNINTTGNLANVKTYSLSPYLHHRFGEAIVTEMRYTRDSVSTNSALLNSNTDTVLLKLDSGTSFKTVGLGFQYNDQKINYANSTSVEMEQASTNVSYRLTPRFSLNEAIGYEKNSYAWSGGNPAGGFWSSGFSWAPTDRTSISASAGRRYYGSTYSLYSSVRSRTTLWSLGYAEDVTTTQSQFSNQSSLAQIYAPLNPDMPPAVLEQAINAALAKLGITNITATTVLSDNYFSNRVFLQKRLYGMALLNSGKSSFTFTGYYTVRTALTTSLLDSTLLGTSNLSLADKTKEAGVNAQWAWKIFPRTTAIFGADYIRVSAPAISGKSDTKRITLDVTKHIQPKLDGSIGYRHVLQKTSQIFGPIEEDAVFASLLMRF